MIGKIHAVEHSRTWELVSFPPSKKLVGCRWVYAIKIAHIGKVDSLKARLLAKGYT